MDPLSDRSLFSMSMETALVFRDAFMVYMIPKIFGVAIEEFEEDAEDYESMDNNKETKIKINPCQTQ